MRIPICVRVRIRIRIRTRVSMSTSIFTTIIHLISNIFQPNEFNLRLLPAISGILCLPLVYKLTKSFFDKQTAAIALFLCSFNSIFIFFSKELKQYTTEAFFALLAICITERIITLNYKVKYINIEH